MSGFKWYPGARARFAAKTQRALDKAAEGVRDDLVESRTLPFASEKYENRGALQRSVFVEREGAVAHVVTGFFGSKRLYYHPEFRFNRDTNEHAGGLWFDPYIRGDRRRVAEDAFARAMRGLLA